MRQNRQNISLHPACRINKGIMKRKGCIYSEFHNRGRNRNPSVGGSVLRKGVGLIRGGSMRWVAEISYHGKRYRCRSYYYDRVEAWLKDMREKFND